MNKLPKLSNLPQWMTWVLFITMLLLIAWFYGFHKIILLGPQSVHFWRQVDCLSFTLNYMMEARAFFNPAIHYIGSAGDGEVITDFPIIFYLVGNIWRLTGQEEWIYRAIVFVLFIVGLSMIFGVLKDWFKSLFWAIFISALIFTSPVIAYYSINFVMNIVSFSFALMGFASFYWFVRRSKSKWLWLSAMFYLLGGLIKIPALMTFVVIVFIYLTEISGIITYRKDKPLFGNKFIHGIPLLLVVITTAIWLWFINSYNQGNTGIFLAGIYPIWSLTWQEINTIVNDFFDFWYKQHFHLVLHIASFMAFFWNVWNIRKLSMLERVFIILLPLGVVLFLALWFKAMPNHDYYLTNSYFLFIINWAIAIKLFIRVYPNITRSNIVRIGFVAFFIFNAVHCKKELSIRYWGWWNNSYNEKYKQLTDIKPYMREAGISRDDRIIAMGDTTPNATLYLVDSKGWSNFGGNMSNRDSVRIAKSIKLGAKYMVLLDTTWQSKDFVQPFTKNLLLEHRSVKVFQLDKEQVDEQ